MSRKITMENAKKKMKKKSNIIKINKKFMHFQII